MMLVLAVRTQITPRPRWQGLRVTAIACAGWRPESKPHRRYRYTRGVCSGGEMYMEERGRRPAQAPHSTSTRRCSRNHHKRKRCAESSEGAPEAKDAGRVAGGGARTCTRTGAAGDVSTGRGGTLPRRPWRRREAMARAPRDAHRWRHMPRFEIRGRRRGPTAAEAPAPLRPATTVHGQGRGPRGD